MINRPIRVTSLVIIVVFVAAWNGLRVGETIYFWKTLAAYGANPLYIAISGAVWLFAGLLIAWGFWLGKAWGWAAALAGIVGYTAWYWSDRLVLQQPRANWPFVLVADIVFLMILFAILFYAQNQTIF